ncbi:MAG TPA: class I SAM-dependent methyltransferase [Candidatus Polarisedimenticolaceae bacterium]|nr:class I SAM-dependent methyltransferase [Candidatus Polarisedimenticolaceae bacterium]
MSDVDTTSRPEFYEYYARESQSPQTLARYGSIRDMVLRVLAEGGAPTTALEVADVGCGAGTQCRLWAERGHRVHGLDVNAPLLELARERAAAAGLAIDFRVGSAVSLPWADGSMDVCLAPELLEHVADWRPCLDEFARIVRPGGLLFVSTSNVLCPRQQEFNLPLYSWYPAPLKRRCERLAVTTHPAIANYAKYPAVNWFSFYSLRRELGRRGFPRCLDRFDVIDLAGRGRPVRALVGAVRRLAPLRWLGHVATSGTFVVGFKQGSPARA